MWFVIEVEFEDIDGDTDTDLYGPYQAEARATEIAAAIERRLERLPKSSTGQRFVSVSVRPLHSPKVRSIAREARNFILDGED